MGNKKETEVAVIDLDLIDVNKLPELANFQERGKKLVKECKFVEISDNSTYETAKKNRTALRTFRTDVEKSDKAIKSKLNNFKNRVGEVSASLIAITEPAEKTQQAEVERYEQIKENERLEKIRAEELRIFMIKDKINEFKNVSEKFINTCVFVSIDATKKIFEKNISDFNRESVEEYEILFDDSVAYLHNLLESKIKTLTEQENIRITQIELAKEKERQRLEAERIAEEQRKEREKLEAEQKAEAEKIRLAKEQFEKEKREFEEKQKKIKFDNRTKEFNLLGFSLGNFEGAGFCFGNKELNIFYPTLYASDCPDDRFEELILEIKQLIDKSKDAVTETREVEFEEVKSEQSANNQEAYAHDQSKGLSTRLKANTPASENDLAPSLRLTWAEVLENYYGSTRLRSLPAFVDWLEENYNCPTRKI